MEKWNEIIQASFINWTKLPKEVVKTEENHTKILEALNAFRVAATNLNTFKNVLAKIADDYSAAKEVLDIKSLKGLNDEADVRNKIIDSNFEMTLNGLSVKKEWETKEEMEERLEKELKLPIT